MKRLRYRNGAIDRLDAAILELLTANARMTMAELAREIGLSSPSVIERVRRLEDAGVIRGYEAVIDPIALGLPLAAYIRIRPMPGQLRKTVEIVTGLEAIVACDRVTGDDCFVAKACIKDVKELEMIIDQIIPYATTNTSLIQSSPITARPPSFGSRA